jgi:hypothetical protein
MPFTTIGFLLFGQVLQADGSGYRNVLLAHQGATPVNPRDTQEGFVFEYGSAEFTQDTIRQTLIDAGLPEDAPLSVLAVEFYGPGGLVAEFGNVFEQLGRGGKRETDAAIDPFDPQGFGKRRILRTSTLTKVEPYC